MPLKLSTRFLFNTGLLLLSLVGLTVLAFMSETGFTGPIASAGILACAGCAFGLLWSAHKYQNTRLSDAGVEQVTMKGQLFLRWEDIQQVRMYSKSFLLESPRGTVLVYPKAYERPQEVSEYVVTRLRKVMQDRGAQVQENDKKFY